VTKGTVDVVNVARSHVTRLLYMCIRLFVWFFFCFPPPPPPQSHAQKVDICIVLHAIPQDEQVIGREPRTRWSAQGVCEWYDSAK
jgi:hypothetical protein